MFGKKKENEEENLSKELQKKISENLVVLDHVSKVYSNGLEAVHDFSLEIKKGDFVVLVGPSGCGKSTTLRMLAGLEDITAGSLYISGKKANKAEPRERGVSMVFQSYALYPHMSVKENMTFGLDKLDKKEVERRIHYASSILGLDEYLDRKPSALSGGQCQRVALGRAIVRESPIFLLDEPLSNLDAKLRVQMRSEIIKLHEQLKNTIVYVTHDQIEAMTMASKLVIMNKGVIQQIGTPKEIYENPANSFVAAFIGSPAMNIIKASLNGDSFSLEDGEEIKLHSKIDIRGFYAKEKEAIQKEKEYSESKVKEYESTPKRKRDESVSALLEVNKKKIIDLTNELERISEEEKKEDMDVLLGLRPEDISIKETTGLSFQAKLETKELLGADYQLRFVVGSSSFIVNASLNDAMPLEINKTYSLYLPHDSLSIFDYVSGNRII